MKRELLTGAALGALALVTLSTAAVAGGTATSRFGGFTAGIDLGYVDVQGEINDVGENYANNTGYQDVASTASGILLGGRIGYDGQLDGNWLVGGELNVNMVGAETAECGADGCFANIDPASNLAYTLESLASIRARVGYVADPNALIYLFAGFAHAQAVTHHWDDNAYDGNTRNFNGYTVGGGGQYGISAKSDIRFEIAYYDFSGVLYTDASDEDFGTQPEALTLTLGAVFHLD